MSAAVSSQPLQLGAGAMTHNPGIGASDPVATAGHQSCSSVPTTGAAVSNGSRAALLRSLSARERESQINGALLQAKVGEGLTVSGAAVALGWTRDKARAVAEKYGIKADRSALRRAERRGAAMTNAARPRKPPPAPKPPKEARAKAAPKPTRLERNPFLTTAQQAQVDAHKNRQWAVTRGRLLLQLPPVTADEAARLVAEFAARRGVTVCAPAAEISEPINAGARWR